MRNIHLFICLILVCLLFNSCNEHPIEQLIMEPTSMSMRVGETKQIEIIVLPLSSKIYNPIYWRTSNPNVATVDNNGNVTAIYSGTCTITAISGKTQTFCTISVDAMHYTLDYAQAIAYYFGDTYQTETENYIIRLLDANLSVDLDGTISGAGTYLNLNMQSPQGSSEPAEGSYHADENASAFSYIPGKQIVIGNDAYASGSYLGQYTPYGLSVVYINKGSYKIAKQGTNFSITGQLQGEHNEDVTFTYYGPITVVDKSGNTPLPDTLRINSLTQLTTDLGDYYNTGFQTYRITLTANSFTTQLECYAPLSATELPTGKYILSPSAGVYKLRPADLVQSTGSFLIDNGRKYAFTSGSATVTKTPSGLRFSGSLIDSNGRIILVR